MIVKRTTSELARPTRRSFLKAVATLMAATAAAKALEPLEVVAQKVTEFHIGGQKIVFSDWVEISISDWVDRTRAAKAHAEAQVTAGLLQRA